MNISTFKILGILLMVFSLSMVPPMVIDFWYRDGVWPAFFIALLLSFSTGFLLWFPCRKVKQEMKIRDGFLIVVLLWSVLSLFGALPFMIAGHPHLSFNNAVFESVSGLTTTGATVLSHIEKLPHAILFYRQQLQFLGGMGIIVLAVAVLPMLGIGGMQLYRTEITSLAKDTKLTPRIAHTAKALWYLYVGLVVLCIFAYWAAGMDLFHAICESFSTVATGGFSTHDTSLGFYHNSAINYIACVFMVLGGTNFSLHYYVFQKIKISYYFEDIEFRVMLLIFISTALLITGILYWHHTYPDVMKAFEPAIFTVISASTTTGFTITNFRDFPNLVPILIIFLGVIGACASSTTGGLKVVRLILLVKQGSREVKRLIHPQGVIPIKLGRVVIDNELLQSIWGFVAVLIALYVLLTLGLVACGLDFESAFSNAVCALGNLGITLGVNSSNFAGLNGTGKWLMVIGMLAGRLEIFSLLILFSPAFWRP